MTLAASVAAACALLAASGSSVRPPAHAVRVRTIAVIAGVKSHGPAGNGMHDYGWSARFIKTALERSNVRDKVRVQIHLDGWPADDRSLDQADALVVISDGRDGDLFTEALHLATAERRQRVAGLMKKGVGLVTFHFSTFAPDEFAEQILDWNGGYFDWQNDRGEREWYSAIKERETQVVPGKPGHPILRGTHPFTLKDEFYFNLRFRPADPRRVPIWKVPELPGREPDGRTVAWAVERRDGGRGFGTTCGHYYDNWKLSDFRKTILNGIVWAAKASIPVAGVEAPYVARNELAGVLPPDLLPAEAGLDGGKGGHWGLQTETTWRDERWNRMATGPFVSATLDTPTGRVMKGIAIQLGDRREAALLFDAQALAMRVGWVGGFVTFDAQRFGLARLPGIAGKVRVAQPDQPGFVGARALRYEGLSLHGDRVVLSYSVDGRLVRESPWVVHAGGAMFFVRTLEIAPGSTALLMNVAQAGTAVALVDADTTAGAGARIEEGDGGIRLHIAAADRTQRLQVLLGSGGAADRARLAARVRAGVQVERLEPWLRPGPGRWGAPAPTRGSVAPDSKAYVIDTLTVPYANRQRALMFLTDIDFFDNGDAAVSTLQGDVWLVRGIDSALGRVTWQRFATGLFQPLGLRIVNGRIHVLGRDQLTVLEDGNGDGEADSYRNLNNDIQTSSDTHEFATCLERDAKGNFYYLHRSALLRISPDGKRHETIAGGWRNPNGLAISPEGTIVVAPQEGEWTPASMIDEVTPGGHYGFGGPRVAPARPLGYDAHLVYIPRLIDNSTGSPLWVTSDRWGPLGGQLLSLSFGTSSMQLILRDKVGATPQGSVVPLEGRFLSGAMRGRFSPRDGQLYVVGTNGWVTNAVKDGSLQRVRYTGKPANLPVHAAIHANGVRLQFSDRLDRGAAEDVGNYRVDQWNYRYTAAYGSEEYSHVHRDQIGHDAVTLRSAHLLDDGRSVFLEIPGVHPVHQLRIKATLTAADGTRLPVTVVSTVNALRPPIDLVPRPSDVIARTVAPQRTERVPGLALTFRSPASSAGDARVARMAALYTPAGMPPSSFLAAGRFEAVWEGWIEIPERDQITFSVEGQGRIRLMVAGTTVLQGEGAEGALTGKPLSLTRGQHAFRMEYTGPSAGAAFARLYWSGAAFDRETVPATAFSHDPTAPDLARGVALRKGRGLVASQLCIKCHRPRLDATMAQAMPELAAAGPSLLGVGRRLSESWIARWVADPRSLRPGARMPSLLSHEGHTSLSGDAVAGAAADIAAYLVRGMEAPPAVAARTPVEADVRAGGSLFATLGCIGCHARPDDRRSYPDRVPLAQAAWKYRPAALAEYLLHPDGHDPWTRMPTFGLTAQEAEHLAAFLVARGGPPPRAPTRPGDPGRGRLLFGAHGCANCHDLDPDVAVPAVSTAAAAPSWDALAAIDWSVRGCVARSAASAKVPVLGLSEADKALVRGFAPRQEALFRDHPAEFAARRVDALGCGACHDRDQAAALWPGRESEVADLIVPKESAITVQTRPPLTLMGDKLRADWLAELLGGNLKHRLRPWLDARMPSFGVQGRSLATGISFEHGQPVQETRPPRAENSVVSTGRKLVGGDGGLNCATCHPIGAQPAQMALHFGVINLQDSWARLRRDFFLRWLLNPQRIDPTTQMPGYADGDGNTVLGDILGGNASRQFDAIWAYLSRVGDPRRALRSAGAGSAAPRAR